MRIVLSVLLLLLCIPGYSMWPHRPVLRAGARMIASAVPLSRTEPGRARVGALTYLGGLWLRSPDPAFGGFSALHVRGRDFTMVSDMGNVVTFSMGSDWHPRAVRFGDLPGGPDTGWKKEDRDSESLTVDPATGQLWIGFERVNQVWRYAPGFARAERWSAPPAMQDWSTNEGPEAMVRLSDGSILLFAEGHGRFRVGRKRPRLPLHPALLFRSDPTEAPMRGFAFALRLPSPEYRVSDATELPDGRILVLTRRFGWPAGFTNMLVLVDRAEIRPGHIATGRAIATLAPPVIHDNFEGITALRENGHTVLWLVSDDNNNILQRTLLLKFRLDLAEPGT